MSGAPHPKPLGDSTLRWGAQLDPVELTSPPARVTAGHSTKGPEKTAHDDRSFRILHVVNSLGLGGTELGIRKIVLGLDPKVFEQKICSIRAAVPGPSSTPQLEHLSFTCVNGRPGFQVTVFRLARIFREFRPDIVHSRNWGAIEAIPAVRLAGVPIAVHSEHGYELEMLTDLPMRRRVLRRLAYSMADAVFTVTADLREYHSRQCWLRREGIRVIYNGVDTDQFKPHPDARPGLRRRWGFEQNDFVIGCVGRLVPIKDHATLLRAAEVLIARGVSARVLLAGSGPQLAPLEEQVSRSAHLGGKVMFLGSSDEVPELLGCMDAFVLPSITEGMSNTLLEAMSAGLPVIATHTGGNTEIIPEANHSRCLFAPGDFQHLADILYSLSARPDLRFELGITARQEAVDKFGLEGMLQRYRDLYCELLERRGIHKFAAQHGYVRDKRNI